MIFCEISARVSENLNALIIDFNYISPGLITTENGPILSGNSTESLKMDILSINKGKENLT